MKNDLLTNNTQRKYFFKIIYNNSISFKSVLLIIAIFYNCSARATDIERNISVEDSTKLSNWLIQAWDVKNESLDSANLYTDSVFVYSQNLNDSSFMAKSRYYKAVFSYYNSDFEEVYQHSNEALGLYGNDVYGKASVLNLQGLVYSNEDKYEEALKCYLKSYQLGLELDNLHAQANPAHNIGMIYEKLENYEDALDNYKTALEIRIEIGDDFYINQSLVSIGGVYFYTRNYDIAEETLLAVIDDLKDAGEDDWTLSSAYNNLGLIYQETNQIELALNIFNRCKDLQIDIGDDYGLMITYLNIAQTHSINNDYSKVEAPSLRGVDLAKKLRSNKELGQLYQILFLSNKEKGNYKQALEFQELFITVRDSVLDESKSRDITELQIQYKIEKKEKEILTLQKDQILKEKDRLKIEKELLVSDKELLKSEKDIAESNLKLANKNRWILIIFLGMVIIITVGWIFFQRSKRIAEKDKNEAVLREKDQGLNAVIEAQEEERKRISKDLHDGIGQQLSGLKLAWSKLSKDIGTSDSSEKIRLEELTKVLDDSATNVRNISHQMMPRSLQELGLVPAIEDMLEKTFMFSDIKYTFEEHQADQRFNERIEISLYRICQELINNCIKHSKATAVSVQLMKSKSHLMLLVEDNGKGTNLTKMNNGHGLLNMKSRLSSIKGEINLDSSPNAGLVAQIRVEIT